MEAPSRALPLALIYFKEALHTSFRSQRLWEVSLGFVALTPEMSSTTVMRKHIPGLMFRRLD